MRNFFSIKRIQNLTDQQKDRLLGLLILSAVASIYYFQWAYYLTGLEGSKVNIDQPERYFWWANDSRSYREAGEWLFGRVDSDTIADRPWLYPFLLGLARTLFPSSAESVLWIGQFLMWLASGFFYLLCTSKWNTIHNHLHLGRGHLLLTSVTSHTYLPWHDRIIEYPHNCHILLGSHEL